MQDREKFTQKALLVQIELFSLKTKNSTINSSEEFRELAISSGATIYGEVLGKQDRPTAKLYLKKGKAEEVKEKLLTTCAELVKKAVVESAHLTWFFSISEKSKSL